MTLAVRDALLADLPARPQLTLLEVAPLADPLVGMVLRIQGAGDLELGGSVQLARMVLMEADGP